jgi:hypothetical protein
LFDFVTCFCRRCFSLSNLLHIQLSFSAERGGEP